jgi:hypothetical protein
MNNRDRGEACAATRPPPAEPSSDPAAEQTLDQHIEEILDYHLSGGAPVPPAETFTSGSGQTVASGNLIPRLRSTYAPELPADQPPGAAETPPPPPPCGARDRG